MCNGVRPSYRSFAFAEAPKVINNLIVPSCPLQWLVAMQISGTPVRSTMFLDDTPLDRAFLKAWCRWWGLHVMRCFRMFSFRCIGDVGCGVFLARVARVVVCVTDLIAVLRWKCSRRKVPGYMVSFVFVPALKVPLFSVCGSWNLYEYPRPWITLPQHVCVTV